MHRALLVMVGDESAAVSTAAYKLLCQIGAQYLKSWEESQKAEDEESTEAMSEGVDGADMDVVCRVAEEEKQQEKLYQQVIKQKVQPSFRCNMNPASRCDVKLDRYTSPFNRHVPIRVITPWPQHQACAHYLPYTVSPMTAQWLLFRRTCTSYCRRFSLN